LRIAFFQVLGDAVILKDVLRFRNVYSASRRAICLICFLLIVTAEPVLAQSSGQTSGGGKKSAAEKEAKEKPEPSSGFRWDNGPSLFLGKDTRLDFRTRLQVHSRESEAEIGGDASAFDIARRRVGVEGRIAGVLDFQVEHEIGDDDPWRDVFANYRRYTAVRVQAGKFKLPFSLDENTSTANLDFVYRSRAATQLAPGRDQGVMVHGRVADRLLRYEAGFFAHDGKNARTKNPEHVYGENTIAARLTAYPFVNSKSALNDFQIGVAFTTSDVPEGISGVRGRTVMDSGFYPADFWVRGARHRYGLEARWRPGPFSVRAEYIRVTTERLGQSVEDTDLSPLVSNGWYVSGTWLVTGEKKTAGGDAPRRPFLRGGIGAVELAARVEDLTFGSLSSGEEPSWSPRADVVSRNGDRAATVGVNWFPIRTLKVQANLIREVILDPSRGPMPSRAGYWSRVVRFQFSL
jgi:phosphate-selective porin OprO/OprP